jgi:hypothetical protein
MGVTFCMAITCSTRASLTVQSSTSPIEYSTAIIFPLTPNSIMNVALPFVATLIANYTRLESLMN